MKVVLDVETISMADLLKVDTVNYAKGHLNPISMVILM